MEIKFNKIRMEVILVIGILLFIISSNLLCGCSKVTPYEAFTAIKETVKKVKKEGFSNISDILNVETYSKFPPQTVDPNSWKIPNLNDTSSQSYQTVKNYKTPKLTLQDGQLDILANIEVKPSCCAYSSYYSNSSGCGCLSTEMNDYLITRGGNSVHFIQGSSV